MTTAVHSLCCEISNKSSITSGSEDIQSKSRWAESGKVILCILTMSSFLVSSAAALGVGIAFHRIDLALGVMSAVSGWVTCVEGALLLLYM